MLDAIDDADVGAVDPFADIARHQPAVVGERLGRLVGLVPVALEDTVVLDLDLAGVLCDPEADARVGLADGAQLHASDKVGRGDGGVLSHAVQLEHRHAEADEELEHLGGGRRGTRTGVPAASQPQSLAHRPEDDDPPDTRAP